VGEGATSVCGWVNKEGWVSKNFEEGPSKSPKPCVSSCYSVVMKIEEAVIKLANRFGNEHVRVEPGRWVRIEASLPKNDAVLWPLLLSPQEASYLATHPELTNEQLFDGQLPEGWPYPKCRVRNQFQAWRGSEARRFEVDTLLQRLSSPRQSLVRFFVPREADGSWITSEQAFCLSVEIIYPLESVWPPASALS